MHLDTTTCMGLQYVFLTPSQPITHAQPSRNGPATAHLLKGWLVTICGRFLGTSTEVYTTSWEVSGPFREQCTEGKRLVEDDELGQSFNPRRWELVLLSLRKIS